MGGVNRQVGDLLDRGVEMPAPATVCVAPEVDPERVSAGVLLHPGCRVLGSETSIGPGCELGAEGPVTVRDCQLGEGVTLKGGTFHGATLLNGVEFGPNAHVRPGTLLEEQASCAHAVGLKQTIFFPFVTAGSLINFCDCLMAGGTSRRDHSEIGSSYVHFNFTPRGDKATASLLGDAPRGIMLDQPAIFLGGQGGLVGPARVAFGTVAAAGAILRRDVLQPGRLVFGQPLHTHGESKFNPGLYGSIRRLVTNNLAYIGNIHALRQWYLQVRRLFAERSEHDAACYAGAVSCLTTILAERVKWLDFVASALPDPAGTCAGSIRSTQEAFAAAWPSLRKAVSSGSVSPDDHPAPAELADEIKAISDGKSYVETVQALSPERRKSGSDWLQGIVDAVTAGNPL